MKCKSKKLVFGFFYGGKLLAYLRPDDCQSQIAKDVWTYLEDENMETDFDELDEIDTLNIQFKNNAQTMKLQNSASSSYTETFVKQ